MLPIQMVDLKSQYQHIKNEIDSAVLGVVGSTQYINGPQVKEFVANLEKYLDANHVIPCGNGTDALQIALMALGLQPGDEVIVPSFTYVATAEVIGLLGLVPVMVDVDKDSFNITAEIVEAAITSKTKAVVPVHLFGQSCNMEAIMQVANKHGLYVIEDNAQSIGADYFLNNGKSQKTGTIGHIGTTSFYPSKNLGCYGDGGAIMTNDAELAFKIKSIANHGQSKIRYRHDLIGVNSRLDAIQAAILNIKLKRLDSYIAARQKAANYYDEALKELEALKLPYKVAYSTHVYHQYTMQVQEGSRDELKAYLSEKNIPSMVYYPLPLNEQEAYKKIAKISGSLEVSEQLCKSVISLPMHTELTEGQLEYITSAVKEFYK